VGEKGATLREELEQVTLEGLRALALGVAAIALSALPVDLAGPRQIAIWDVWLAVRGAIVWAVAGRGVLNARRAAPVARPP